MNVTYLNRTLSTNSSSSEHEADAFLVSDNDSVEYDLSDDSLDRAERGEGVYTIPSAFLTLTMGQVDVRK